MRAVYFPNLNGLRFIAALWVIIHHIEQIKLIFKVDNYWHLPFVDLIGKLGVVLFFVLSGFLITYLLLQERAVTGTIAIRHFYLRRVLRIWPLYYLIVALGLFVLPHIPFFDIPVYSDLLHRSFLVKVILFIVILPNLVATPVPHINQTWSIGVEEQFYAFWPLLMKKVGHPLRVAVGTIVVYLLIKFGLLFLTSNGITNQAISFIAKFWNSFNVDCMAIGGVIAWALFYRREGILRVLFNRWLQAGVYLLTAFMIVRGVEIPYLHQETYACLFAVIILNLAANKQTLIKLEHPILHYLGKISFGIYMYHMIAIVIAFKLLQPVFPGNNWLLYSASILLTILLAAASYEWFERRFIKAKIKYSKVVSGDNIAEPATSPPGVSDAIQPTLTNTK
ncbi:acyltransferase family protein [Larkinella punicea]|uniref:Acyltransferase n=1 Tax=Larkinella punicea TaxID=2315727 RepID=A0A368JQ93_9BACT|nr:acyltransferase [Larkinella punicea]RCR69798.1 acyltransferase [Larkinella punicea]